MQYLKNREFETVENEKSQVYIQTPLDVLSRALRNCTWSAELYIEKIRLSEKSGVAKATVLETAQQAFEATNSDVKGHLKVWLEYLSYLKRNTNLSDEKDVEVLRKTMDLGQESLASRTADAHSEFNRLCARIEYGPLQNGDQGYQQFDKVIKNFNNQNKAVLWIEFAYFDLNRGVDAARRYVLKHFAFFYIAQPLNINHLISRIFRRAIKVKNIDDFDMVMSSWKSFEYVHGTVDQIQDCDEVCDKIIENYNRRMGIKSTKPQKRKPDAEIDSKIAEKKQKTADKSPTKATPAQNPFERKRPEAKAQPVEPEFGGKDEVSVFLSNLSYEATKEEILAAFPELKIKDVTLILAPNGRGKGYGYLELKNPSEVEKAIEFDRRSISGRPVFITRVLRDKNTRTAFKYSESKESNKIFIKGLPFDTTKNELQILFGTFGTIKDIRLVTKK